MLSVSNPDGEGTSEALNDLLDIDGAEIDTFILNADEQKKRSSVNSVRYFQVLIFSSCVIQICHLGTHAPRLHRRERGAPSSKRERA